MLSITSKENKIFKKLKKLYENRLFRKSERQTILIGEHLIDCCLNSNCKLRGVFIDSSIPLEKFQNLFVRLDDIPKYTLTNNLMREISLLKSCPGIIALADIPSTSFTKPKDLNLFLDDIQDPGNLGSIIRSAQAFNINAIFLSENCADVWSPKTLRGSQGAQFLINCHEKQSFENFLKDLSIPIFSLDLKGSSLSSTMLKRDMVVIIGNEGNGVNKRYKKMVKASISIPMNNNVESLNVASAASIMMYEYNRQFQ